MKTYEVLVGVSGWKTLKVEAESADEAKGKVYETNDYTLLSDNTEWDIETVEEIK